MVDLEIRYGGGPPEVRPISKVQPISIGRHVSNDICIDEPGVAPIHCRVLWNNSKTHFEITSANRDGVELNGTLVRVAGLKEGDVLRIGSADLIVRERDLEPPKANIHWDVDAPIVPVERREEATHNLAPMPVVHVAKSEEIPLKPAPEDTAEALQGWDRNVRRRVLPADHAARPPVAAAAAPPTPAAQAPVASVLDEDDDESEVPIVIHRQGKPEQSFAARLSQRLSERQVRPGEQQALRSPFILGMLGLTFALALAAGAIFLVIGRETTQQEFAAAKTEFDAKRYGQASELFEKYETDHPKDPHAGEAHYQAWNARVLKEIGGGSPAWKRGRDTIDKYVEANRERSDLNVHFPELADFLTRIALGAARSAEASIDTDQLELASQAESMAARYFPDGKVPAEASSQFQEVFAQAQNVIEEHRQFTGRIAEIEKAIADRQPMAALAGRRELLARYSKRAGDAKLAALLEKTLNVEKSLVSRKEFGRAALRKESAASPLPHVSLVLNTRSHSEEAVRARSVLVLAKDSCYAVDHLTGEPVWRRVIGLDSPFLPMSVDTAEPGLLLFDSNRLSLELISRQSGKLIWEQPINEPISGSTRQPGADLSGNARQSSRQAGSRDGPAHFAAHVFAEDSFSTRGCPQQRAADRRG